MTLREERRKYSGPTCPHCGRYTGPADICPYCRNPTGRRVSLKALRVFAIAGSIIGLLFILAWAHTAPDPQVDIADIKKTMNFGRIYIEGTVTSTLSFNEYGSLGFSVHDGTGDLRIRAYDTCVKELKAQDKIPALGDTVKMTVQISYRDDFQQAILGSAYQIEIAHPIPEFLNATQIHELYQEFGEKIEMKRVITIARVCEWTSSGAPYVDYVWAKNYNISDGQYNIELFTPTCLANLTRPYYLPELIPGQWVFVEGSLTVYGTRIEIIPVSASAIVVADTPYDLDLIIGG